MSGIVVRHWQAQVLRADLEAWIATFRARALPGMKAVEGWLGISIDAARTDDPCAVTVTTRWKDEAALRRYAGDAPAKAVVPDFMSPFLVSFDPEATFRDELVMESAR